MNHSPSFAFSNEYCKNLDQGDAGSHAGCGRYGTFHLGAQRRVSDGNIRDQTT